MKRALRFLTVFSVLIIQMISATSRASAAEPERLELPIHVESKIKDVSSKELGDFVLATLNDPRSWVQANVHFTLDSSSKYRVVLDEPKQIDALCKPLSTGGEFSCQNGPVVALNANKWRKAFSGWDGGLETYRQYMVNHEVGHLFGQRHPKPSCPKAGGRAAVMEQQSKGLKGCKGNAWPLAWEIEYARQRPLKIAPLPDWAPDPVPVNQGDTGDATTTTIADASTPAPLSSEVLSTDVATTAVTVPTTERALSELGSNIDAASDTEVANAVVDESGPSILVLALGAFGIAGAIAAIVALLGRRSKKLRLVERKAAALLESTRQDAARVKAMTIPKDKPIRGTPDLVTPDLETVAPTNTHEPKEPTAERESVEASQSLAPLEHLEDSTSVPRVGPAAAFSHDVRSFGSRAMSAVDVRADRSIAVVVVPGKGCALTIDELLAQTRALLIVAVDLVGEEADAINSVRGGQFAVAMKATCAAHAIGAGAIFVNASMLGYLSIGRVAIGTANAEGFEPVISSKGEWKTESRVDHQLVLFGGAARPLIVQSWPFGEMTETTIETLNAEADKGLGHPFVVISI